MAVYKDEAKGTWRVIYRYTDWTGKPKQTQKRGFKTKREAQQWEWETMLKKESKLDMTFASFCELYEADRKPRLKASTWETKDHMIRTKLLPYFGNRKIAEIDAKEVIAWQNKLMAYRDKDGKGYSPDYLRSVHAQLSAIFNHAVKYYKLPVNPARVAGTLGKEIPKEMDFWTKEEYLKFAEAMMDKPVSYYAFEMLYWTGIREGELLALTPEDFDFKAQTVTISKTYHRMKGEDIITSPKTAKSNRTIKMPEFLCEEMQDYLRQLYQVHPNERIFPVTKYYLNHEMVRGCKASGVKKIRVHDIRHSHVSLLINMGFSALAIGERVGHEAEKITYRYAHGNWRSKAVTFNMSPEEDELFERMVHISGLCKRDFIAARLLNRDVMVQGNPKVYKALKDEMAAIRSELERIAAGGNVSPYLLDLIRFMTEVMNGMKEKSV